MGRRWQTTEQFIGTVRDTGVLLGKGMSMRKLLWQPWISDSTYQKVAERVRGWSAVDTAVKRPALKVSRSCALYWQSFLSPLLLNKAPTAAP